MDFGFKQNVASHYLEQRIIIINDVVEDDVIEKVVLPILSFNEEDDELEETVKGYDRTDNPIKIYIHTVGGGAHETLSIISAITSSKTPVETIALGHANSAGFFILVSGHKRSIQKYSRLCYHQVQTFPSGGPVRMVDENLDESKMLQDMFTSLVLERTKIPKHKLEECNERRSDWYMGAEEALSFGIVDEII